MILADEYQDATKEKTKSSVSSDTTLLQRAAWDVKIDNSECHGTFSILVAVEIWRLSESLITVGMWLAFGVVWGLVTGFFLTSGDVSVMNHMIPFVQGISLYLNFKEMIEGEPHANLFTVVVSAVTNFLPFFLLMHTFMDNREEREWYEIV